MKHIIRHEALSLEQIRHWEDPTCTFSLSEEATQAIQKCRDFLDQDTNLLQKPVYGINTGFGSLCDVRIDAEDLAELQRNLVMSHASGIGPLVPPHIIRLMLGLKIQSLSYGHSGVQVATVQRLIDFFNAQIYPVIYTQGSLGASGDLAPLAHLSLPLLGLGEVYHNGQRRPSQEVLNEMGWEAIPLQSKEGLALLNGTQFSTAYLLWAVLRAEELIEQADMLAALSLDAFDGLLSPFDARLHQIRRQQGQAETAEKIRHWLRDSDIAQQEKDAVQDPYAFRCAPQVHGASRDTLRHVRDVLLREANSVSDNPNIFVEDGEILSGGNFHAQPIALAADFLAIALAELGSISERRTYQLIGGKRGLPPFLTPKHGLHSGFMIPQYTAASIVSQNKQLCTPASVDSIVSCNGQEDHVSMAANAGTKLYQVVDNIFSLFAIEWMNAAQALTFRAASTSSALQNILSQYRHKVPQLEADRVLATDMAATKTFLKDLGNPTLKA